MIIIVGIIIIISRTRELCVFSFSKKGSQSGNLVSAFVVCRPGTKQISSLKPSHVYLVREMRAEFLGLTTQPDSVPAITNIPRHSLALL